MNLITIYGMTTVFRPSSAAVATSQDSPVEHRLVAALGENSDVDQLHTNHGQHKQISMWTSGDSNGTSTWFPRPHKGMGSGQKTKV